MLGTRIATVILAMLTLGVAIGGTMAHVVTPGPIPTPVAKGPVLVYTIAGTTPPTFGPYYTYAHTGPVQFHFVNMDRLSVHAYMLVGSGWVFIVMPMQTLVTLAMLDHPGIYQWVNLLPYQGTPQGALVGILAVS